MGVMSRAIRNIGRKKVRTILVALAVGFSIAAIISVQAGINASHSNTQNMINEVISNTQGMIDDYERYLSDIGNLSETQENLIQVSQGGRGGFPGGGGGGFGGMGSQTPVTQQYIDNISSLDMVEDIVPHVSKAMGDLNIEDMRERMDEWRGNQSINPGSPPPGSPGSPDMEPPDFGSLYDYFIEGVPVDPVLTTKYSLLPVNITSGRQLTQNDYGQVVIRDELTDFFQADVGDMITIEDYSFEVVGIYSSDITRNTVYMTLSDAQKVAGLEDAEFTSLDVYAEDPAVVDMLVYEIQDLYPTLSVSSYAEFSARSSEMRQQMQEQQITQLETGMQTQVTELEGDMANIENTGNQVIIISAITVCLIVLFLMSYTVRERIKEIGTLKALGFPGGSIMSQFVIEGTLIGLIGGVIGIVIAVVAAPFLAGLLLPSSEVYAVTNPTVLTIGMALGVTALLGALGSIYPAWSASRKSPVEAMSHE